MSSSGMLRCVALVRTTWRNIPEDDRLLSDIHVLLVDVFQFGTYRVNVGKICSVGPAVLCSALSQDCDKGSTRYLGISIP
jgi:hypothetical protein